MVVAWTNIVDYDDFLYWKNPRGLLLLPFQLDWMIAAWLPLSGKQLYIFNFCKSPPPPIPKISHAKNLHHHCFLSLSQLILSVQQKYIWLMVPAHPTPFLLCIYWVSQRDFHVLPSFFLHDTKYESSYRSGFSKLLQQSVSLPPFKLWLWLWPVGVENAIVNNVIGLVVSGSKRITSLVSVRGIGPHNWGQLDN